MKNKFEVGMYARYKMISYEVKISKIKEIKVYNDKITNYKDSIIYIMDDCEWVNPNTIIKASHNIIDLIEPMDLMYIDISPDDCGGIVVPRIAESLDELKKYKDKINSGEYILKGVVTKEQYNSNCYRIGSDE